MAVSVAAASLGRPAAAKICQILCWPPSAAGRQCAWPSEPSEYSDRQNFTADRKKYYPVTDGQLATATMTYNIAVPDSKKLKLDKPPDSCVESAYHPSGAVRKSFFKVS